MDNPFTLTFGKEPKNLISREQQNAEIFENFLSKSPDYQVLMFTGVRGSGKTVSLTVVSEEFKKKKDWIVIELNPERDMIQMLTAELSNRPMLLQFFKDASIDLSFLGFGLHIDGVPPITDVTVALDKMLSVLTKRGKRILITIDEASCNSNMKIFAAQFQIFIRKNYSIFLMMTGLYENIYELQNEKTLTFLYRAPKIEIRPLNIGMIAEKYKEIFNLSQDKALSMAKITKGYSYAFQLLGYLCYKRKKDYTEVLLEFDANLQDYVYEKIWSELSDCDQRILNAMALLDELKVEEIRNKMDMPSNIFSVYRQRLIKRGIIYAPKYGYLDFTLPRFKNFVLTVM